MNDITERAFNFALRVIKLCQFLNKKYEAEKVFCRSNYYVQELLLEQMLKKHKRGKAKPTSSAKCQLL